MSINKRPIQKISKSRNGFDMSQRQLFTSAVGQCLPVYYDLLQPGDSVNIDSALLSRTQTLSSNPMTRVSEHIDYFFVPYRRIYSNFPQFYTTMLRDVSSGKLQFSLNPSAQTNLPSVNLASLITNVPRPDVSNWHSGDPFPIASTDVDEMGVLKLHNAKRLLDLLGFGGSQTFSSLDGNPNVFAVNPALLCAYHAIDKDFYRLDDRTLADYKLSNMDDYYNNPPSSDILSIYYRPWKRDFYTNIETSPLFGGYYNEPITRPQMFLSQGAAGLTGGQSLAPQSDQISYSTANMTGTSAHNTTIDQFRRMGAQERLAQLQRFNRKYWNVQMSALFGIDVPDNYDHVLYLGSHHYNLQFSDVVGTATTSDSVLGEVVGKGIGLPTEQKPIKFQTKQHGFIMAIYSAIPDADYVAQGMDKLHTYLSKNDFYNAAYDNLGMQPKYAYEFNMTGNATQNANVQGWVYRWQELKQKPDLIHGAFQTSLRHWVTSRSASSLGMNWWNYCISPSYLDSIGLTVFIPSLSTALSGSGTVAEQEKEVRDRFNAYFADTFGRDPLLHQLYFKALKVSEMSEFALPSHNAVLL